MSRAPAAADRAGPASAWPWVGVALALGLAAARAAGSFGGWFLEDDVLNLRWVLEYRDAPWLALTERHALHDHVRPLNLLAQWAGARLSDGDWWGPHLLLSALLVAATGAGMALAGVNARPGSRRRAAALAGLLLLALPGVGRLLTWNAWMGSAGELACGLWAVVAATVGRRTGRLGPVVAAWVLVAAAGLFKEPGWIVYPAAIAALVLPDLARGRRDAVTLALAAVPLLGAAGLAFVWHPANPAHYLEGGAGPGRLVGNLATALGSVGARWPLGGRPEGLALPLLLLGLAVRRGPPTGLWVALASTAVMLPNPDFHVVHVLPAAFGVVAWLAPMLAEASLPAGRAGRAGLAAVALYQAALLIGALRPSPPLDAERALRERLLPLAALYQALDARALVLPPAEHDQGGGAYQREATAWLAPLFGMEVGGADGPRGLPVATDGGELQVDPAAERRLLDRNLLASLAVRLAPGPGTRVEVPAGWYALGAVHRGPLGRDPVVSADDGCGGHWEARRVAEAGRIVAAPLRLEPRCLPLTLAVDQPPSAEVLVFLVALDRPRLGLHLAPEVPRRLDVASRSPVPTPMPAFLPRGPGEAPGPAAPPDRPPQ